MIRELSLTKSNAELLLSRLKEWHLIDNTIKITDQRKRHHTFSRCFSQEEEICFCSDLCGLFSEIGIEHVASEWRLFIDSNSVSLKAVLLHNGNQYPSIPVAFSSQKKESYHNVKIMLELINYNQYSWSICGDFKIIGFLRGLQSGYTKHSCFLCLWNSRSDDMHFNKRQWPIRVDSILGQANVVNLPLVPKEKILLPPLHLKLGIIKQFFRALKDNEPFLHTIQELFPSISREKIRAGVFTGPQVNTMLESSSLPPCMSQTQLAAWRSINSVRKNFLGNYRAPNYEELINGLICNFQNIGARMSLKLHMFHSHLNFFSPNLGAVSEEHGERFHQDIKVMEQRYNHKCTPSMMGDYIWNICREGEVHFKRKSRKSVHF